MELTIFDIIAVTVIGLFAFLGFRKGLVAEVFKILGVVIGIVLALQYMAKGAVMIHSFAQLDPRIEKVLAFIAILLITIMVFIYLAKIAKLIFKMALMGWLDRGGGLLFGGLKGALIISSFLPLFLILPDSIAFVKETRNDSIIYKYLQGFAPKVYDSIAMIVPGSESFADKLKSVIPSGGSLSKISAGEVDLESLNMIQQFMGSEDSEMLQELQKQLGDMKIEDMNLNTAQPKEIQDILDKYTKDKKKKKR
ncbi:MAG: CvpA family protein [Candidatus Neomarinimicrobiota bacterium]